MYRNVMIPTLITFWCSSMFRPVTMVPVTMVPHTCLYYNAMVVRVWDGGISPDSAIDPSVSSLHRPHHIPVPTLIVAARSVCSHSHNHSSCSDTHSSGRRQTSCPVASSPYQSHWITFPSPTADHSPILTTNPKKLLYCPILDQSVHAISKDPIFGWQVAFSIKYLAYFTL